ncbi:hypothetical protein EVAR_82632_1 [Eumeta japonica]|uniref:Uncharacterized protein n=1 Tax=Eumeta variegata TaxID=151549 RepID=A0A4C1V9U6_EUMVA|nr:hypothetical protein EVAR_82632_1 [Eumeta japonica]
MNTIAQRTLTNTYRQDDPKDGRDPGKIGFYENTRSVPRQIKEDSFRDKISTITRIKSGSRVGRIAHAGVAAGGCPHATKKKIAGSIVIDRVLLSFCYCIGSTSPAPQDSDITYVRMLPAIAKSNTEQPSESSVLGLQESRIENVPLIIGNASQVGSTHSPEMQSHVRRNESTTAPSTISKETTTESAYYYTSTVTQSENAKPAEGKFNKKSSCVRPLSLFSSDASADGVEERSLVLRSRSHARLRRNATMSHAFSCMKPAFIDL